MTVDQAAPEADCQEVNPATNTVCDRSAHGDGWHWHGTDDHDPLPLLRVAWETTVDEDDDEDEECYALGHDDELRESSDGIDTYDCRRCGAEWQQDSKTGEPL